MNSIKGASLLHVALLVNDIEKSINFYTNGLGFKKCLKYGGSPKIEISENAYIELFRKQSEKPAGTSPVCHFAIATDDCKAAIQTAEAAGAEITKRPTAIDQEKPEFPTRIIAFVKGPDEEVIEFVEHCPKG